MASQVKISSANPAKIKKQRIGGLTEAPWTVLQSQLSFEKHPGWCVTGNSSRYL